MRTIRNILLCAAGCVLVLLLGHKAFAAESRIRLVYFSRLADIQQPQKTGGLAALASLLGDLRKKESNVVFVHGGSAIGPSALASFDKGAHMIGLLNRLEPAVMAVGRRDFTHKEDELSLRAREAEFPLLAANVIDPFTGQNLEGLTQSYILPLGTHSIGFVAIVSPALATSYVPDRVQVTGGFEELEPFVRSLRRAKADVVIALADFVPPNPAEVLQQSGADMLLISDGTTNSVQMFNGHLYAVHGKADAVLLAELLVDITKDPAVSLEGQAEFVPLVNFPADPSFAESVQGYTQVLDTLLGARVGLTETELDTTTQTLRSKENAFANMVTDALREYYGAQAAFINAGALRGNKQYPAMSLLTRRDLHTEMPLHDASVLLEVTGADLLAAIEHGLAQVEEAKGTLLQVSGIRFTYDPAKKPGARVLTQSLTVGGKPWSAEQKYTVATVSFLAGGGDGFAMLKNAQRPKTTKQALELAELVRVYITGKEKVRPVVEGRIQVVR